METFVQLPDETRLTVLSVVVSLVSWVLVWLAAKIPVLTLVVERYGLELARVIAAAVLELVENALPSAYPDPSVLAVQLLLAILAVYGVGAKVFRDRGVKGFRQQ